MDGAPEPIPPPPVPSMAEIWAFVAAIDPLLVHAVAEVDRRLLVHSLGLTPRQRLQESSNALAFARRWRRESAD